MSIATDLQTIANNVPLVYNAGVEAGKAQGGGGGFDTATIKELTFALQKKGSSTIFDDTFNSSNIPGTELAAVFENWGNYPITRANRMFQGAIFIGDSLYTENLNFSASVSLFRAFADSTVTKLKTIDAQATVDGWSGMAEIFSHCSNLVSIEHFYPSKNTPFNGTFGYCTELTTIIFESEISVNGLGLGYSKKLDKASITSAMTNLSDTTSGLRIYLSLSAVNKAFETSVGANDGSSSTEWGELVDAKPNWDVFLQDINV